MATKIYTRSPYLINGYHIYNFRYSRMYLRVWRKDQTQPTLENSNHIFLKDRAVDSDFYYDISPYVRDYINFNHAIELDSSSRANSMNNWVYCSVDLYGSNPGDGFETFISTNTYIALDGYTSYMSNSNSVPMPLSAHTGANYIVTPLYNTTIVKKFLFNSPAGMTLPFFYERTGATPSIYLRVGGVDVLLDADFNPNGTYYKIVALPTNLVEGVHNVGIYEGGTLVKSLGQIEIISECKYNPLPLSFVNRYGGIETITFFKASKETILIDSKQYRVFGNLTSADVTGATPTYNTQEGQYSIISSNGSKSMKLNTGWVTESTYDIIEQLLISESVKLIRGNSIIPVTITTQSMQKQLSMDSLINYSVEVKISYDVVNTLI